jgi:hypothetical protein
MELRGNYNYAMFCEEEEEEEEEEGLCSFKSM